MQSTTLILLFGFMIIDYFVVRDRPSQAGHADLDTGDASSGEDDTPDASSRLSNEPSSHSQTTAT